MHALSRVLGLASDWLFACSSLPAPVAVIKRHSTEATHHIYDRPRRGLHEERYGALGTSLSLHVVLRLVLTDCFIARRCWSLCSVVFF